MNKKTWIACLVVLVLIAAALLIFKPFGAKAPAAIEPEVAAETAAETVEQSEPAQIAETLTEQAAEEETSEESETSGAYILENQGDLEIVIPDDEESAGF